ncbi:MAG: hypothetical protein U0836_15455 [Pirellulales bacterium]
MNAPMRTVATAVFNDVHDAQQAVAALQLSGFHHDEIGFLAHDAAGRRLPTPGDSASKAGEGAVTGLVAGAGAGGLWALGIAAGLLPAIGPVIAGGFLASVVASAAAGAAAGGVLGALIGMGVPDDEAQYYDEAFRSGRHLVTVRAGGRFEEAFEILRSYGGQVQPAMGAAFAMDLSDEVETPGGAAPRPSSRALAREPAAPRGRATSAEPADPTAAMDRTAPRPISESRR